MRFTLAHLAAIVAVSTLAVPARTGELKIDGQLRALQHHGRLGPRAHAFSAPSLSPAQAERFSCFIQGSVTAADLEAMGIHAGTQAAGMVSGDLSWSDIERLSAFPGVEAIRMSHRARPLLDVSRAEIHANTVNGGTAPRYTGTTGKGVVVGVVDTGIDWNHPDFSDTLGNNRILYIWDQTVGGTPPSGFAYGREWTHAAIQSGTCSEIDADGHGTHVTGTAAGSGKATGNGKTAYRYVGIAPQADIIFVKTDFTFSHIVDGVNYIFQRASALGKPAVVNLSLGSNYGPHDGTEAQDQQISALTGPGKLVCVSAGNSGADSIHAELTVSQGTSSSVTFRIPSYSANQPNSQDDYLNVDAYYKVGDSLAVQVQAPNGWTSPSVPFRTTYGGQSGAGQGYVYVDNGSNANLPQPLSNNEYNLIIEVFDLDSTKTPAAGFWTITVTGTKVHAGGHMDLWMADSWLGVNADIATWRQGFTPIREVSTPGSADSVICVGAYMTKKSWQIPSGSTLQYSGGPFTLGNAAYFSSHGPSADGRPLPFISAPGFGVASSRSSLVPVGSFTVEDSVHFVDQGTSMACPHVVGVSALILQKRPTATPSLAKLAIQTTALADLTVTNAGPVPNTTFGWGKLRADAALSTTPVGIFALDGQEAAGGFELSWAVAQQGAFSGFDVERSAAAAGPWLKLNDRPLDPAARVFRDKPSPGVWFYRVSALRAGSATTIGPFRADITGKGQYALKLFSPVPNPFRESSTLSFVIPGSHASHVKFGIFDVSGRRVASIYDGYAQPGRHDMTWDGSTASGTHARTGLYFARLESAFGIRTEKLALMR